MAAALPSADSLADIEHMPNGSRIPVPANFAALKNDEAEIIGAVVSFMDLTERKKLEQQSIHFSPPRDWATALGASPER